MIVAALSAAMRHGAFPAITAASTPLSIVWMRDLGLADMWGALILAVCAGLYLLSARTAAPYDENDALSRWMPSGASIKVCAALLALFAAALLAGAM